jgi:hypothetical protein
MVRKTHSDARFCHVLSLPLSTADRGLVQGPTRKSAVQKSHRSRPSRFGSVAPVAFLGAVHEGVTGIWVGIEFMHLSAAAKLQIEFCMSSGHGFLS